MEELTIVANVKSENSLFSSNFKYMLCIKRYILIKIKYFFIFKHLADFWAILGLLNEVRVFKCEAQLGHVQPKTPKFGPSRLFPPPLHTDSLLLLFSPSAYSNRRMCFQ